MITIQILTHNNESTIGQCLQSVSSLNGNILIGDIGSNDKTVEICKSFDAKVIELKEDSYSKLRNFLIEKSNTDWQLFIEPWEYLDSGSDNILWSLNTGASFNLYVIQDNVITKETRLWKKSLDCKFQNPVYEAIYPQSNKYINSYLQTNAKPERDVLPLLLAWKESQPTANDIDYYLACTYLMQNNIKEFIRYSNYYLFGVTDNNHNAMLLRYYRALVYSRQKEYEECIKEIVRVLALMPTMAELWCLLGDCFFKLKQYYRATSFYNNALLFGSRRRMEDPMPIEINKYKEHPQKMLEVCQKLKF